MPRYRVNVNIRHGVAKKLGAYFPGCQVTFENESDPETGRICTWAYVHTSMDVDTALATLERFDDEWWLEISNWWECEDRLQIGLRFVDSTP